jgi:hypothetical protein
MRTTEMRGVVSKMISQESRHFLIATLQYMVL